VDPQKGFRNSFKYAIRCTTSCLRSDIGVSEFLKRDINFKRALKILEEFMEEEIIANTSKMIRLVLRDDNNYDRVVAAYPRLGDFILQLMKQHNYSAAVN